jgi:hypothetical protein
MTPYTLPLTRLLGELKPKKILEIGIGYDAFSTRIWLGDGETHVTTVDKGDWGGFGARYERDLPDRFTFIKERSEIALPKLTSKYDLIYIDGDHSYEGCKADILNSIPLLAKNGVMILDDYGVTRTDSAVDISDTGKVISGAFGVKKAADECLKGWEVCYEHLDFANGGRAYRRALKSR